MVEIETALDPYALLEYCNDIEQNLKRERLIRWGPRTIDLDILLFDEFVFNDEKLTIPHPRMCERAFVMIPLYEIAKNLVINGKKIEEITKNLKEKEVRKVENI